ncbi:MAG: undecaprenyl-diphosphate phosphatase [Candidatus Paceibacterota bacterium]
MNFFDTLILGTVEGLTEFLPVSSTAHLIVTGNLLKIPETEFFKTFVIVIQLGAILAVVLIYWQRVLKNLNLTKKIITAFIPTAVIGFILYKIVKNFLFENLKTIALALIIGGIIIIIFEILQKNKIEKENEEPLENISYKKSFLIGVIQALAIIPGVSRSGATIIGGMALGISRKNIVEFSFLLAVPTLLAATGYDLIQSKIAFSSEDFLAISLGFLFSFVFAYLAIKFFIRFIQTNSFVIFGVYRIFAGLLILIFLI